MGRSSGRDLLRRIGFGGRDDGAVAAQRDIGETGYRTAATSEVVTSRPNRVSRAESASTASIFAVRYPSGRAAAGTSATAFRAGEIDLLHPAARAASTTSVTSVP